MFLTHMLVSWCPLESMMDLQLNGKRALITGSSIGIGEASARAGR
jgi:hypothetical protein